MKKSINVVAVLALAVVAIVGSSSLEAAPLPALPVTSNLVYWLDAGDLDGDGVAEGASETGVVGGKVTAWVDKAAGFVGGDVSQTALQGTLGNQPNFISSGLNTRPVVRFDGVDDFLKSPAFAAPLSQPVTSFMVWKADSVSGVASVAYDGLTSTNRHAFVYEPVFSTPSIGIFGGSASTANYVANPFTSAIYMTGVFNNPSSSFRINGSDALTGITTAGSHALDGVTVGSRFAPQSSDLLSLDGYIAEFLIFDGLLSDTDRDAIEAYLQYKWFDLDSTLEPAPVPEPSTVALLGLGILAFARSRRNPEAA